jgi:hypothetical protein
VKAEITPLAGRSALISARVQGTSRFYAAGFEGDEMVIVRENHGTTVLARAPFKVVHGQRYALELSVIGDEIALKVDGREVLTASDAMFRYGMAGPRMASGGRMQVHRLEVEDFA